MSANGIHKHDLQPVNKSQILSFYVQSVKGLLGYKR